MSNEPTTADYAYSDAQANIKAIRELEKRVEILEGICRVATVANPFEVEEALMVIKAERDEREKVESARQRQIATDRLPEEKRRMQEMMSRSYSFGTLGAR